jgi:FMN phosphatase YigB (HAD superfamily)
MIVIFDLDYALLDTEKIKKDMVGIFNISIKQFNADYKKLFTDKKIPYSPYKHIRFLKKEKLISSVSVCDERMDALVKNIKKYLYPKALEVLEKFKKRGDKTILMSVGDLKWQAKKINGLKIKKYFSRVIIVERKKCRNLEFLKKENEKILIINDNAGETIDMEKAIGKCEVCLIHGPYSNNVKHNLKVYKLQDCLTMYD